MSLVSNKSKIVVIGDIHGYKKALVDILRNINFIDKNEQVLDSNIILVQVGDIVDRGPKSLESLKLMQKIQKKKPNQVIRLLGNHEIMLLCNDYRFINKKHDTPEKINEIVNELRLDIILGNLKVAHTIDNFIFSHAGITKENMKKLNILNETNLNKICKIINTYYINKILSNSIDDLYDINNIFWNRALPNSNDYSSKFKQIIGHTIKQSIDINSNIIYVDLGMFITHNIGYLSIKNGILKPVYL